LYLRKAKDRCQLNAGEMCLSNKFTSKSLALIVVLGALYAALTVVLAPVSYGPVQVRVAEVLKPAIFFWPLEGTIALVIGVIAANLFSPIGISDVIQAVPGVIVQGVLVYLFAKKLWHSTLIISAAVALWVGTYLWYMFKLPWVAIVTSVLAGEIIAVVVLGLPLWTAIKARLPGLFEREQV